MFLKLVFYNKYKKNQTRVEIIIFFNFSFFFIFTAKANPGRGQKTTSNILEKIRRFCRPPKATFERY